MNSTSQARLHVALTTTLLLWSTSFSGIRQALADYSPYHLALLRFAIASLLFGIAAVFVRIRLPGREDLPRILLAGLIGVGIYHSSLNFGQQTVTAGAASFIINMVPIFTGILAALILGEHVPRARWAGITVSFLGIALITLGERKQSGGGWGAWFILLAALAQSVSFILVKPLFKRYSAIEVTCYAVWTGTVCLAVFLPGLGHELARASLSSTLLVLYLGIFPAAVGSLCWTYVLGRLPASRAASFLYLSPPLSLLVAWGWLGEVPGLVSFAGCCLAMGGVLFGNFLARRNPSGPGGGPDETHGPAPGLHEGRPDSAKAAS
jgi:drug/metabolite transporter (DMT)-like permease